MGVITARESRLGTIYEKYSSSGDLIQQTGAMGFIIKDKLERTHFILVDWNGIRIKEANKYLNVTLMNKSYKKRESAFTALKHLYSYVKIFNVSNYQKGLSEIELVNLTNFLKGGKKRGTIWDLELGPIRRNETVNKYFTVYRDFYVKIFYIMDSVIQATYSISYESGGGFSGHADKKTVEGFESNLIVLLNEELPEYITFEQYEMIIKVVEEKYNLREKALINLMYRFGLRLGEALGLTFEDVRGNLLFIRNRFTDKPDHSAKGVMNIKSRDDYNDPAYHAKGKGGGYQDVVIDSEMSLLLEDYIDESRDPFLLSKYLKKRENYEKYASADRVTDYQGQNYYIFINRGLYTPLSGKGWGGILKEIFKEVGLEPDVETKKKGLSHLFRHGFAMFRAHDMGHNEQELAAALRHSGTRTVMRYYKPNAKDRAVTLRKQNEAMNRGGIFFHE